MTKLKTLVAMQLRDKIDLNYLKSTKATIFKVTLTIIKYMLITGIIYYAFYILSMLRLVSLMPGIPQNVLLVLFTAMIALSTLVGTVAIMKSLYFTKDNALLLTLPTTRSAVFTSKLVVYYLYELLRNSTYILPLLVAYGLINNISWLYYLWLVPAFLLVTAVPVAIGALLSIPLMIVTTLIRRVKALQYSVITCGVVLAIITLVAVINALPEDIDLVGTWGTTFWAIQDMLTNFSYNYAVFGYLLTAIVGKQYGVAITLFGSAQLISIAVIIAAVAVVLVITYLLVRPLFFKMASTPFEYKKSVITKQYKNSRNNAILSNLTKELKLLGRDTDSLSSLLYVAIGMPLAILLLNNIYGAISVRLDGLHMAMAFNVLIMLLLSMSTNIDVAHIYSKEGASGYLNKTVPQRYQTALIVKLLPTAILMAVSLAISTVLFADYVNYSVGETLLVYATLLFAYISHLLMSAESDIMNPQNAHYATTGTHSNNPNDIRSGLLSFVMAIAVAGWSYFLIGENTHNVWIKMSVLTLGFMLFRVWSFLSKIAVYYKEK